MIKPTDLPHFGDAGAALTQYYQNIYACNDAELRSCNAARVEQQYQAFLRRHEDAMNPFEYATLTENPELPSIVLCTGIFPSEDFVVRVMTGAFRPALVQLEGLRGLQMISDIPPWVTEGPPKPQATLVIKPQGYHPGTDVASSIQLESPQDTKLQASAFPPWSSIPPHLSSSIYPYLEYPIKKQMATVLSKAVVSDITVLVGALSLLGPASSRTRLPNGCTPFELLLQDPQPADRGWGAKLSLLWRLMGPVERERLDPRVNALELAHLLPRVSLPPRPPSTLKHLAAACTAYMQAKEEHIYEQLLTEPQRAQVEWARTTRGIIPLPPIDPAVALPLARCHLPPATLRRLHHAAARGDQEETKLLINEMGPYAPNCVLDGYSLLARTCESRNAGPDLIRLLIEMGSHNGFGIKCALDVSTPSSLAVLTAHRVRPLKLTARRLQMRLDALPEEQRTALGEWADDVALQIRGSRLPVPVPTTLQGWADAASWMSECLPALSSCAVHNPFLELGAVPPSLMYQVDGDVEREGVKKTHIPTSSGYVLTPAVLR